MRTTTAGIAWTAAVALTLVGCGGSSRDRAAVTVSTRSVGQAATAEPAAPSGLTVAGGLVIERVKIAVRDVELERHATAASTPATGSDDGTPDQGRGDAGAGEAGEVEVSVGPFLVDVTGAELAGGKLTEQFTIEVAEGTYDKLKFKVHHLENGQTLGDADFDSGQASIVVKGKLPGGAAFTWTSRVNDAQEHRGNFVVGGKSPSNITLTIDFSRWFVDGAGALLDPSSEANRAAIEANIRSSIDGFCDNDHDGRDDG